MQPVVFEVFRDVRREEPVLSISILEILFHNLSFSFEQYAFDSLVLFTASNTGDAVVHGNRS